MYLRPFNVVSLTRQIKVAKVGKNANKVAKFYLKPENAIDIAVDTGMNGDIEVLGRDYYQQLCKMLGYQPYLVVLSVVRQ